MRSQWPTARFRNLPYTNADWGPLHPVLPPQYQRPPPIPPRGRVSLPFIGGMNGEAHQGAYLGSNDNYTQEDIDAYAAAYGYTPQEAAYVMGIGPASPIPSITSGLTVRQPIPSGFTVGQPISATGSAAGIVGALSQTIASALGARTAAEQAYQAGQQQSLKNQTALRLPSAAPGATILGLPVKTVLIAGGVIVAGVILLKVLRSR